MDDRLRHFKILVEQRSFTVASRQLRLSQPALSVSLSKLEKQLGVTLLIRAQNHFEVTAAGQATYQYACDRLRGDHEFRQRLAVASGQRSLLRIGAIDSMADMICDDATLFGLLDRTYELSMTVNDSRSLLAAVDRLELDFAITVFRPEAELPRSIHQRMVGDEALVDVSRSDGFLGGDRRLIAYHRDSVTFGIVRDAYDQASLLPFEPEMFSTSPQTMLRLVRLGRGHATLPYPMVKDGLRDHSLIVHPVGRDGYAHRPIAIIYRQLHSGVSVVHEHFAAALRKQTGELDGLLGDIMI